MNEWKNERERERETDRRDEGGSVSRWSMLKCGLLLLLQALLLNFTL